MLELPQQGESNNYPWHMFLGILNTVLFNFSNNPFQLKPKICSIQIVVIKSFVVISNVGIKRGDCIYKIYISTLIQPDQINSLVIITDPLCGFDSDRTAHFKEAKQLVRCLPWTHLHTIFAWLKFNALNAILYMLSSSEHDIFIINLMTFKYLFVG